MLLVIFVQLYFMVVKMDELSTSCFFVKHGVL